MNGYLFNFLIAISAMLGHFSGAALAAFIYHTIFGDTLGWSFCLFLPFGIALVGIGGLLSAGIFISMFDNNSQ